MIQTIHVSVDQYKLPAAIHAVQNDTGRTIKMIVDDLTLVSGMTGKLSYRRSSGTFYEVTATLDTATNSFSADLDQALTSPGTTHCQLKVNDTNSDLVSSFDFDIFVEEDRSGVITPEEGISISQAVQDAEDAADRAESAASTFETDTSLSVAGMAADAKTVGDDLDALDGRLDTIEDDYVTESEMTSAISANVDNTLSVSGKAADAKAVGNEISGLKSAIDGVESVFPESVYSAGAAALVQTTLGNCDNTGTFSDSVTRARTDYLPLDDYYSLLVDSSLQGERSYWVRLFDADKTYIGSANGSSAVQTETTIQSIKDSFPSAVYGIAVVKCLNPNDGSLAIRPHGMAAKAYVIDGSKTLDDVYARIDNIHQVTVRAELECGDFGQGKYAINALKNWRSKFPIRVIGGTRVSFDFSGFSSVSGLYIWKYGSDFSYLGLVTISDGTIYADLPSDVAYIRFEIDFSTAQGLSGGALEATLFTDRDDPFIKNFAVDTTRERFCYKLKGEEYYTNGMLKLPSNYSVDGKPVPLIVFCHGSADYYGLTSSVMTTNYEDYYNFLRDNGYAIFDCFGWGNKYMSNGTGANTWATPTNTNCYVSGIEFVCDRFNIDKDNIFVAAKSLGGIQAAYFMYSPQIKVKAVGLLAPEVNQLCQNLGYSIAERQACADDFGFSEDTNGVLETDPFVASSDYKAYILDNVDKLEGWIPAWYGLQLPPSTRVTNAVDYRDGSSVDYTNVYKYGSVPVKIWFAMDDQNINPYACSNFVKALRNAGCRAVARIMPDGTGAHHSVDTDPNALQTTNVVTPLGITYATIPTAYYELAEWFNTCAMVGE